MRGMGVDGRPQGTGVRGSPQGLQAKGDQVGGADGLHGQEHRLGRLQQLGDPDAGGQRPDGLPGRHPGGGGDPQRRPPASALRTVSAVSGPGTQITTADTPRNASSWPATAGVLAPGRRGGPEQDHEDSLTVSFSIQTDWVGVSPLGPPTGTLAMVSTTSRPSTTSPNTE
jgi:hypothetical protein